MKLPETAARVENLTQKVLEHHGFPQCIGAIDGTHIAIRQPNQNYADCINRKGFTSVNVRALCDYRYCFLDVVMRWPGSVHDSRIFLQSNLNQKLWNKFVPSCEKQIVKGEMKVPICILGDPAYPLLPFLMKEYPKGGKDEREQYFGYRLSSTRMVFFDFFSCFGLGYWRFWFRIIYLRWQSHERSFLSFYSFLKRLFLPKFKISFLGRHFLLHGRILIFFQF